MPLEKVLFFSKVSLAMFSYEIHTKAKQDPSFDLL